MYRNVILVGFMGTGKTTIGKYLAEQLGWEFVDSDREVERKAGLTIPELFAAKGEPYFRQLETEALTRVLADSNQVVATGGGAVLREENRRTMLEGGLVVALLAGEEAIIARVKGDTGRPLLQGDVTERVKALMETRRGAYDFAPLQLDTEQFSVDAAAERIKQVLKEA